MTENKDIKTIAVAADDDRGLEGRVSAHFGRCPYYVVAEVEGDRVLSSRVVTNPNAVRHQPGAMPHYIHGLGADVIIAGGMGPRAIQMFEQMGIEVVTGARGTIEDTISSYIGGSLSGVEPCEEGDDGHHGGEHHHGRHVDPAVVDAAIVAFSVHGPARGLEARLDPRFGRAERFMIVDTARNAVLEELDNPLLSQAHGVGSSAAALVAGRGAKAVVSGRFGPNAMTALEGLGIAAYVAEGDQTIAEVIEKLRSGALERQRSTDAGGRR